jgi:hypothetical protein
MFFISIPLYDFSDAFPSLVHSRCWICFHSIHMRLWKCCSVCNGPRLPLQVCTTKASCSTFSFLLLRTNHLSLYSFVASIILMASSDNCQISIFTSSALITFAFNILQVSLMVIAFAAWRDHSIATLVMVSVAHLTASLLTLLNTVSGAGCAASIPSVFVVAAGAAVVASKAFTSKFH